MDYYIDSVSFSKLPKEEVQKLLLRFVKNTQPDKLRFNPTIIDYSDTQIRFGMNKHYGQFSLSLDIFLKNLSPELGTQGIKMMNDSYSDDFLKLKVGNIEYFDTDVMRVDFFTMIIRIDSIAKLFPGGLKEFSQHKDAYGATNGRLFTTVEMRSTPLEIDELYTDMLEPNGFKDKKDFVCGFSGLYEKKDYGKPIEWCIVPWLESVITPYGSFVKFLNPNK